MAEPISSSAAEGAVWPLPAPRRALLIAASVEADDLLARTLVHEGYAVQQVDDAGQAEAALAAQSFDLVALWISQTEALACLAALRMHADRARFAVLAIGRAAELDALLAAGADEAVAAPPDAQTVLRGIRLLARLSRQGRLERILQQIGRGLAASTACNDVLATLVTAVRDQLGFDRAGLSIYDAWADCLRGWWYIDARGRLVYEPEQTFGLVDGRTLKDLDWYPALIEENRDFYYNADLWSSTSEHVRSRLDGTLREILIVAMRVGRQMIGVLRVDNLLSGRPLYPSDAGPLVTLAEQAALAWERARLAEEAEALDRVTAAFASELDVSRLYTVILEQAARVLPSDQVEILLHEGNEQVLVATWGEPRRDLSASRFPLSGPGSLWLPAGSAAPSYLPDTAQNPHWVDLPPLVDEFRIRSMIGVPLVIDGVTVGSFGVGSRIPHRYSEQHLRLAAAFGERATQALRTARLYAAEQERARVAEALAQEEARFRLLFANNPYPLWVYDHATLAILEVNQAATECYGYSRDEFLTLRLTDLLVREDIDEMRAATLDPVHFSGVRQQMRKDGSLIDVEVTARGFRSDQGETVLVIAQDVTSRTHAEAESAALAEVSRVLSLALDPVELYGLILEQAARVLPCDHASVLIHENEWASVAASWGQPTVPVGTPIYHVPDDRLIPTAMESGRPLLVRDTAAVPNWQAVPPFTDDHTIRSLIVVPLVIDGVVVGAFHVDSFAPDFYTEHHLQVAAAIGERVTQALRTARLYAAEQARARAAEELVRLRDDFVATVSHELRTPLTAIIGYAELLITRWVQMTDSRRLEQITKIIMSAHRQQRLMEDMLLLSQMESGAPPPPSEQLLLIALVGRAAEEVRAGYPGQQIDSAGSAELQVWAHPGRIMQILVNLLDNAAKYSPEGSPIAVSWATEQGMAVVRVRDRGVGVPEEGRALLFTRFGRIGDGPKRAGRSGTGLGLYLGRQLAAAMGGDLDLESTGAEGSVFRLRLPLAPGT